MDFSKALQLLREGKKIRRSIFACGFYYDLHNLQDYKGTLISMDDINSDDWEVLE